MNNFGRLFRLTIFGESHGPAIGITIDGCPAGLPLSVDDFVTDMDRRRGGNGKGTTPRTEADIPEFLSGIFNGMTTGSPLTMIFENVNIRSADYEKQDIPRPGHADLVASLKYGGFEDHRGGGHFSGRLTVALVAAGVVSKKLLALSSTISCNAFLKEIGGEADLDKGLQKAIDAKDSIGGIVECVVTGIPAGLGSPFFDSVESLISHAVFSIPATKGIEFGAGFASSKMFGSEHNDAFVNAAGITSTNNAGGVTGGLSDNNPLVFRVSVKPTSSTPMPQQSLNLASGDIETFSVKGRHDLCIALRVPVVVEAVTACVLTDLLALENKLPRIVPA